MPQIRSTQGSESIPSDDARQEDTSADSIPADRILCVRTIDQTIEHIPVDVFKRLEAPPDDDEWVGCLVQADQLDSNTFLWAQVKHLPPIQVVGKTSDGESYMVAVASSRLQSLRDLRLPFLRAPENSFYHSVSEPSHTEARVHGKWEARQKSESRYVQNAVQGILSKRGRGLGRYYRRNTRNRHLLPPIEWAVLMKDIQTAPSKVFDLFCLSCLFLALRLLDDLCGESALELVRRDREAWMKHFRELGKVKTRWPVERTRAEMQEVSLLRAVFASAGGRRDAAQLNFDEKRSANDNLAVLGNLFDIEPTGPVSFGGSGALNPSDLLLKFKPFQCNELDVAKLQQQIPPPIMFPITIYGTLPADLINALQYQTVTTAQCMIQDTYREMPWLREPENDLPLFLCQCAILQVGDESFLKWMASANGQSEYRRIIAGLPLDSADEVLEPVHDSYWSDFLQHLNGHELRNRRTMWEKMACSFRRVGGYHRKTLCWLDATASEAPLPQHWLDGLPDQYWRYRLEETHGDALDRVRNDLEATKALMAGGCGLGEKVEEWEMVCKD
ncbi:hypothetical protein B0T10DRAFT_609089 [Thelonectria olida]|uniref:Uncharacterized protein n=1 Tax=Thelonectria olida TaxID=1576542 RepID=A0A9P9ALU3_9HYPO|nr:hypothetical protein B0T10DRAFT_609089 [Thelonectria olida]